MKVGDSVAVNGVCLTAVAVDESGVEVEVVAETLRRSNLGRLAVADRVNLELPLSATGRLDGHVVQGHVDGVGEVTAVQGGNEETLMTIAPPPDLMGYIAEKGSVAVDGVSLTVAGVQPGEFTVALIPHTLQITNLGLRKPGDLVNLEMDILAKYVERLMQK